MSKILANQTIAVLRFKNGTSGELVFQGFFTGRVDQTFRSVRKGLISRVTQKEDFLYLSADKHSYVVDKKKNGEWELCLGSDEVLNTEHESFQPKRQRETEVEPEVEAETEVETEVFYSSERPEFNRCVEIVNTADELKSAVSSIFECEDTVQRLTDLHIIAKSLLEQVENICLEPEE